MEWSCSLEARGFNVLLDVRVVALHERVRDALVQRQRAPAVSGLCGRPGNIAARSDTLTLCFSELNQAIRCLW